MSNKHDAGELAPKNLEARLHLAWLKSELKKAVSLGEKRDNSKADRRSRSVANFIFRKNSNQVNSKVAEAESLGNGSDVGSHSVSVTEELESLDVTVAKEGRAIGYLNSSVPASLEQSIEKLWKSIDQNGFSAAPVESGIRNVDFVEEGSRLMGLDERLASKKIDAGNDEFFSGLDELSAAFDELDKLLPQGSAGLQDPAAELFDFSLSNEGACATASALNDLDVGQVALLQGMMEDINLTKRRNKNVVEKNVPGMWNGIPWGVESESESVSASGSASGSGTGDGKRKTSNNGNDNESASFYSENSEGNSEGRASGKVRKSRQDVASSSRALNPIDLLVDVAKAMVAGDRSTALHELERLHSVASIYGDASQRLSAYFLEGLTAKITGKMPKDHIGLVQETDDPTRQPDCNHHVLQAFQVLLSSSPYITFGQVSVNCCILEAFIGSPEVHIVDFGIGHGLQWPPLLQALANRPGGPPSVRMTAVDLPVAGEKRAYCVIETGLRLRAVARTLKVPFEYDAIASKLEHVSADSIDIRPNETVAVNCALRLSQIMDDQVDPDNPRNAVLQTVRSLNPTLFTVVEQHTNHNSPFFLARFYEALYYYATVFDSLGASLPAELPERRVFEQNVLGKAIVNVLACEGQNRVERQEPLSQWQTRIRAAGFQPKKLSKTVEGVVKDLLKTYRDGYGIGTEDEGSLNLTWQGVPLLDMSAWEP